MNPCHWCTRLDPFCTSFPQSRLWPQKMANDLQYMRTVGPILDTRLMLMSVLNTVLRRWDRKEH